MMVEEEVERSGIEEKVKTQVRRGVRQRMQIQMRTQMPPTPRRSTLLLALL